MRGLPHSGKLLHLSPWLDAAGHRDTRRGWPGSRAGGETHTLPTVDPHPGIHGSPRERSERAAQLVRDLPCPDHVPRMSSAGSRTPVVVSPVWVPRTSPEFGLRARGKLQRLSQHFAVLSKLPPAIGARLTLAHRHARLPRRVSRFQPRTRSGGTPEPGVVHIMSRRARLHRVSFSGCWRVPLQPTRSWLRRGQDACEEPVTVQGMPRQRDPEGSLTASVALADKVNARRSSRARVRRASSSSVKSQDVRHSRVTSFKRDQDQEPRALSFNRRVRSFATAGRPSSSGVSAGVLRMGRARCRNEAGKHDEPDAMTRPARVVNWVDFRSNG